VLLGSGMVAATAAGFYPSLVEAAGGMQQGGRERRPNPAARARFDRDYAVFLRMHAQRRELDALADERL
jgi:ribulose kinase